MSAEGMMDGLIQIQRLAESYLVGTWVSTGVTGASSGGEGKLFAGEIKEAVDGTIRENPVPTIIPRS